MVINKVLHRKGLYSANEIHQMIVADGYIPVANHDELYQIRTTANLIFGLGTVWEGTYAGGLSKKYVQVEHIKLTSYLNNWVGIGGTPAFSGIYDGNRLRIDNLNMPLMIATRSISIFGTVSGTVQNVISSNNIINNNGRSGGFAIICNGLSAGGYVLNCFVYNSVLTISGLASSSLVTGTVSGTVDNCWSFNNVSSNTLYYSGDFCYQVAATGIVKNSGTINGTFNGGYRIGLFVGANQGSIENCIATGNISANVQDTLIYTGGFCGQQLTTSTASIKKCASLVNIIMNVQGGYVGGFIGTNAIGLIENCYCRASISRGGAVTNNGTGGFSGLNGTGCNITNCYCSSSIDTLGTKQGFVALNNGTITNSYWNTDYYPTSTNGIGRTTTQLMDLTPSAQIFTNWDTTLWEFGIPNDYPILKLIKEKYQLTPAYIGIYSVSEIGYMIGILGYIPVVSATELNQLRNIANQTFGVGTVWEGTYLSGLDKKYIQLANIDLTAYQAGTGWNPIGSLAIAFTGVYDGNYFKISNCVINNPNAAFIALFGYISTAKIKNLELTDFNIIGSVSVGALVGYVATTSEISHITVIDSTITGTGSGGVGGMFGNFLSGTANWLTVDNVSILGSVNNDAVNVGGLVGLNAGSTTYSFCVVRNSTISKPNNITSDARVGGFIGVNGNNGAGRFNNCYVINTSVYAKGVNGGYPGVGGFVGITINGGPIFTNCYSNAAISKSGTIPIGGFCGKFSSGAITNSYYDTDISGQTDTGKGLPRNTLQMNAGTASSFILPDGTIDPDSLVANAMYTNWLDSIWDFGTTSESPIII